MNIQPVVEGHGEVNALPVLLRRLRDEAGLFGIEVNSPIRRTRSELVNETTLPRSVELARLRAKCGAILILLDSDDDCPKRLSAGLQSVARAAARDVPCRFVFAHREYEAWFLGAMESLRGVRGIREDANSHSAPEKPRDAKGEVENRMIEGRSYLETTDQAAMSARFDLGAAHRLCRSFRKLVKSFGELVREMGEELPEWPPLGWTSEK